MNEKLYWLLVFLTALAIPVALCLTVYLMSLKNIFFTQVPQGEIVTVMIGGDAEMFLANIQPHWIDKKTGLIWRAHALNDGFDDIDHNGNSGTRVKTRPGNISSGFHGIYWLGVWPFAKRYVYRFRWNKWEKKTKSSEFDIQERDELVDSVYHMSAYAFPVKGAKDIDKIPVDSKIVTTTRVVNTSQLLFGVKNGWFTDLDGKIESTVRDFIGSVTIDELTEVQHEEGQAPKPGAKAFIEKIRLLNSDSVGNKSILRTLGIEIVSSSFRSYEISDGPLKTGLQGATTKVFVAEQEALAFDKQTAANVKRITDEGVATAGAAKEYAAALATNPHAIDLALASEARKGVEAMAAAIKDNKGTLVLGNGVLPTISLGKST
jgi:hypothetical protein